jgi:hypothetical protein
MRGLVVTNRKVHVVVLNLWLAPIALERSYPREEVRVLAEHRDVWDWGGIAGGILGSPRVDQVVLDLGGKVARFNSTSRLRSLADELRHPEHPSG